MKKSLCLLLCVVLLFSFTSCGKSEEEPEEEIVYESRDGYYQNPLTGLWNLTEPYTGRPCAFSMNNLHASWPQYGTTGADIVFEVEAEGGITRLFCIFTDPNNAGGQIGSMRSMRKPFIESCMQWDPLLIQFGSSTAAEDMIAWEDIENIDGFYLDQYFFRDKERLKDYDWEHCAFTTPELVMSAFERDNISSDWNPTSPTAFNFNDSDTPVELTGGSATQVNYFFSPGKSIDTYDGDFRYDASTGKYLKYQFGDAQMDANNNQQLSFDNLFILYTNANVLESGTYEGLVGFYFNTNNKGYYICGGKYEEINWTKPNLYSDFVFTKADGTPLVVNPGVTHIGLIRDELKDTIVIS